MSAVIDLPRIRRALSELDRIATEHPEICQGLGQWDEKAVAGIITGKPGNERQAEYRRKLAAQGIKREVFFATPEAQTALAELRALHPDKTRDNILCDALLTTLAAQRTPAPLPAVTPAPVDPDTLPLFEPDSTDSKPVESDTDSDQQDALMLEVDRLVNAGEKWRDIARILNDAGCRDKKDRPLVFSRLNEQWRVWKQNAKNGSNTND